MLTIHSRVISKGTATRPADRPKAEHTAGKPRLRHTILRPLTNLRLLHMVKTRARTVGQVDRRPAHMALPADKQPAHMAHQATTLRDNSKVNSSHLTVVGLHQANTAGSLRMLLLATSMINTASINTTNMEVHKTMDSNRRTRNTQHINLANQAAMDSSTALHLMEHHHTQAVHTAAPSMDRALRMEPRLMNSSRSTSTISTAERMNRSASIINMAVQHQEHSTVDMEAKAATTEDHLLQHGGRL